MPRGLRIVWLIVAAACLVLVLSQLARGDVPRLVNYQGLLVDSETSQPLVGRYQVVFELYQDPVGGAELWSETDSVEADAQGVFSIILGAEQPINADLDGPVWLELVVEGETLVPRRAIVSVPFALRAAAAENTDSLGGFDAEAFAASAHDHDDRYFTESEVSVAGTINAPGNPVDCTKIKGVPAGFADGSDSAGGVGDGYSLDAMDGDPADALLVDDQGDVGIGLTNPQARLDVEDSSSANGTIAIRGTASSTGNGNGIAGVVGETRSTADFNAGAGVMGFAASPTGGSAGVMGAASGDHGAGVYGVAHHVSGQTYGVYGECVSPNGWAGYFAGARSYFSGKVGIGWAASVQPKLYVRENSDLLYATAIAGEASSVTAHNSRGVVGTTYCTDAVQTGAGVMGIALGSVSKSSGVLGVAAGGSGRAIEGIAEHETGENIAIHGVTHSTNGFSCYMEGPRNYFSGRVGIGTTTPQARLHVHEAAGLSSAIEMTNVSTGNGVSDGLQLGLAADGTGKLTNFEDKALSLGTDRIARMTIQPDGKISIGGSDTLGTVTITDANPSLALNSTDGGSHPGAGISFCHQGENQGFIGWSGWDDQLVIGNGAVYVELGSQRLGVGTGAWSPKDLLDVTGAGGTWGGVNGYTEVVGHFTNDGSGHTAVSIDALERDIENLRAASGGAR